MTSGGGRVPGREGVVIRPQGNREEPAPGVRMMGLTLFLASLTVLFVAGLVAYVVVRNGQPSWPPVGAPPLPSGLWITTLLLAGCSVTIELSVRRVRGGDPAGMRRFLLGTLVLALAFVASQLLNWRSYFVRDVTFESHLYGFTFYMLTVLHAVHVLGGMVALLVTLVRARRGAYSWAGFAGLRYTAIYWHYLGVVWVVLFGLLSIDR